MYDRSNNACGVATFPAHSQDVTTFVMSEFLKLAKKTSK